MGVSPGKPLSCNEGFCCNPPAGSGCPGKPRPCLWRSPLRRRSGPPRLPLRCPPCGARHPWVTYKTITPTVETNVVATNLPVPVAVGGYKAVAGDNGDLKGAVHEVPALFGAPALNSQVNDASQGSLTVGTSAVITHTAGEPIVNEHTVTVPTYGLYGGHFYGKREAEETAAAPVVYAGYPYAVPHVVPATHEVTYKTVTPTVETNVVAT